MRAGVLRGSDLLAKNNPMGRMLRMYRRGLVALVVVAERKRMR